MWRKHCIPGVVIFNTSVQAHITSNAVFLQLKVSFSLTKRLHATLSKDSDVTVHQGFHVVSIATQRFKMIGFHTLL